MKQELDIHDYKYWVKRSKKLVRDSDILEQNKGLVFKFKDYCLVEGMGLARIDLYLGVLKLWSNLIDKEFDKAKKEDLMKVVSKLQEISRYSPRTKATYRIMIKRFYKWLKNTSNGHHEEVAWINRKYSERDL